MLLYFHPEAVTKRVESIILTLVPKYSLLCELGGYKTWFSTY